MPIWSEYDIYQMGVQAIAAQNFPLPSPTPAPPPTDPLNFPKMPVTQHIFGDAYRSDVLIGSEASDTVWSDSIAPFHPVVDGIGVPSSGLPANTVFARGGNDIVYGGFGRDTLHGGDGDDLIYGYTPTGQFPGLTALQREQIISLDGADHQHGGAGNDTLFGGGGNDFLFGGSGNDLLIGGPGADILVGGQGSDVFRFEFVSKITPDPIADSGSSYIYSRLSAMYASAGAQFDARGAMDIIVDFQVGIDKLDLRPLAIHTTETAVFLGDDALNVHLNRLQARSEVRDGSTYVEFFAPGEHGVGYGGAYGAIRLLSTASLTAGDFVGMDPSWW